MEFSIALLAASVVIGLIVGIFSGMLGIGGGTLLVPAFRLIFGVNALAATATSLFTIIPTSISGFVTHIRKGTCVVAMGVVTGLGGACTSWAGVMLAQVSPSWCVMAAAAAVIAYSSVTMFRKALALKPSGAGKDAAKPAATEQPDMSEAVTKKQLVQGFFIGVLAGLISGYVGVGGGFLMVPLFLSVLGLSMKKASGTSLIAVMLLALPATITQFTLGNVQLFLGLAIAVGSIPGAMLGARLQKRIPERTLRFVFGGFLLVAAALLLVRELGLLG